MTKEHCKNEAFNGNHSGTWMGTEGGEGGAGREHTDVCVLGGPQDGGRENTSCRLTVVLWLGFMCSCLGSISRTHMVARHDRMVNKKVPFDLE